MRPAVDFATVAEVAASGGTRIFIAICADAASTQSGAESVGHEWEFRESKAPAVLPPGTGHALFAAMSGLGDAVRGNLILAPDAWQGDTDEDVISGWAHLNSRRDAIRTMLQEYDASLVFFVPEHVFRLIAASQQALDLLGLAQVESADDESPALDPQDPVDSLQIGDWRKLIASFEAKYQLSTTDFRQQVNKRLPTTVSIDDQTRWCAAISYLRKVRA